MDIIHVIDGGLLTTVQDLGRQGFQRYGVPVSGAMDGLALRLANLAVGNAEGAAALEITLVGPQLRFLAPAVIAIGGADLDPHVDDRAIAMWEPVAVTDGETLSFGGARAGARAYLAVGGGLDVPPVLGSRSTYTRSRLGGVDGRPLRAGDTLRAPADRPTTEVRAHRIPRDLVPDCGHSHMLRVVLGPQDDGFTPEGIRTFLASEYVVTPQSDRIGYRLDGPRVQHRESPDIVSDGIAFGAVQVAGDGMPIVLLADRGTTGGYTKIATVISVDLRHLAQALPGDSVRFSAVTLHEAQSLLRDQRSALQRIEQAPAVRLSWRRYRVLVDGAAHYARAEYEEQRLARVIVDGKSCVVAIGDGEVPVRATGTASAAAPDEPTRKRRAAAAAVAVAGALDIDQMAPEAG